MPPAGTPLDTSNNVVLYYNAITAFRLTHKFESLWRQSFVPHFRRNVNVICLTLFPKLTGSSLTIKFSFPSLLTSQLICFSLANGFYQDFWFCSKRLLKLIAWLIVGWLVDNIAWSKVARSCGSPLNAFEGVWLADNFHKCRRWMKIREFRSKIANRSKCYMEVDFFE